MYSFHQCLTTEWLVKSEPLTITVAAEDTIKTLCWHMVKLRNDERLLQDVGSSRPVNGRYQEGFLSLAMPENVDNDINYIFLLDSPVDKEFYPSLNRLLFNKMAVFYEVSDTYKLQFPGFETVPSSILYRNSSPSDTVFFNTGLVRDGGFYLLFKSDIEEPIDITAKLRYEVNVNNV